MPRPPLLGPLLLPAALFIAPLRAGAQPLAENPPYERDGFSAPQDPILPKPASDEEDEEEAGEEEDLLVRARQLYAEGISLYQEGEDAEARLKIAEAFETLGATISEWRLAAIAEDDFDRILETVRAFEAAALPEGAGSGLDVSEEELAHTRPEKAREVYGRRYTVPVDPDNEITRKYIALYTGRRRGPFLEALERSGRYRDMIETELKKAGLPREIFYLVMAESEFKQKAYSRAGAAGLWQFMPATGRRYGLEVSYWVDERLDPELATQAAIRYLKDLYAWFGDWHLALAAYNRGEGGVGRSMRRTQSLDFDELSSNRALPRETRHYVPKIMACIILGDNPGAFGFHPDYEKPEPYDQVVLKKALSFELAAKVAGTTVEHLRALNPAVRGWATPARDQGYVLRIPSGKKDAFLESLAKLDDWTPGPEVVRYRVRRGDYLGKIARRFGTSIRQIMRDNRLRSARRIYVGQVLRIRPGKRYRASAKPSSSASGGTVKHRVRRGDSLSEIAARYGTTVGRIMRANGISNPRAIHPGQVLAIRGKGSVSAPKGGEVTTYKVRRGDALSIIAERFGTNVKVLLADNDIRDPDGLRVGQLLKVRPGVRRTTASRKLLTHRVRRGESLALIASRYRTSVRRILRDNTLRDPDRLYPGQALTIRPGVR